MQKNQQPKRAVRGTQGAISVGVRVEYMFSNWPGEWYPGTIRADNGDGTAAIHFDDDDKHSRCAVTPKLLAADNCRIRVLPRLALAQQVWAALRLFV